MLLLKHNPTNKNFQKLAIFILINSFNKFHLIQCYCEKILIIVLFDKETRPVIFSYD